jgi:hypothetical protein
MASVAMANGVNANLLRNWVVREGRNVGAAPAAVFRSKEEFIALPLVDAAGPSGGYRRAEGIRS